ncbi:uncharacterized protein BXZ73DRAFT_102149 [Epithele typhae]|uniref:uncharacterized protein n=1 Tax=Epithele typhae TaxID=378194 RepID=UPI002008CC26|nr:uncharacterized protein BXZ73DRAFT_102149 [Epithele typhae]KAH9929625.1 hypothetical protein BXZ73DRAFT_102149 [Epithele typhae]
MPLLTSTSGASDEPSIVILMGWMGGMDKTVQKYAEAYKQMYPSSEQVIVLSKPVEVFGSEAVRAPRLRAALDKLADMGLLSTNPAGPPPRILIHAFSNGGSLSLSDLASSLHKRCTGNIPGTKCALIFDSAPAPSRLGMLVRAVTASMRSLPLRVLTAALLTVVWAVLTIMRLVAGDPDPMAVMCARMQEPTLLPWTDARTPRLYLCSTADKIVPLALIEQHAAEAKAKGYPVRVVKFQDSAHVSHAKTDPERYWRAVREFWEEAVIGA